MIQHALILFLSVSVALFARSRKSQQKLPFFAYVHTMALPDKAQHVLPCDVPYMRLDASAAFATITPRQRIYAHHMNNAAWSGVQIAATQVSVESAALFPLFVRLFLANPVDELRQAAVANNVSDEDFEGFLEYAAHVYVSCGNYYAFGDRKFLPRCTQEAFRGIIEHAPHGDAVETKALLDQVLEKVFSLTKEDAALSFSTSGFYGGGVTAEDAAAVALWMKGRQLPENTRLFKVAPNALELRVASIEARRDAPATLDDANHTTVTVVYGDHAPQLTRVVASLEAAIGFAANDTQTAMLRAYVEHFRTGDMETYKQSQRLWVKDAGPEVECCIGFVENYRDPSAARAEFEGFTAVVDKEEGRKYEALVDNAQKFVARLPWGPDFEKTTFNRPDYSSLQVLGFVSTMVPGGINIPNFDDIREEVGFKNVTLANVITSVDNEQKLAYITAAEWELFKPHRLLSWRVNVAIHEMLGHGSGKLLAENEDGTFNFDPATTIHPLTKQPVTSWWKPGETWNVLFGRLSPALEECRAEASALYLCLDADMLEIFEVVDPAHQRAVVRALWLGMMRSTIAGLEFYDPEKQSWNQAHSHARFAILQALLQVGVVSIVNEGTDEVAVTIDDDRIRTDGKAAVGALLLHLQAYKSTADVSGATAYFQTLTKVDERFLAIREIVLKVRKPRRQFVQAHTRLNADGSDVELLQFDASPRGIIASLVARHKDLPL